MANPDTPPYKDMFIYTFSFVGISTTLVFGVFQHFKAGNYYSSLFELLLCVLALLNVIYYCRKRNYILASNVILVLMVIILTFLIITGGLYGTGIYWIYTFPLLTFFMKPLKQAVVWNVGLVMVFLILYWLKEKGVVNLHYNWINLRQALGAYLAVAMLSSFYSLILNNLMKRLEVRATVDPLTGLYNRAFVLDILSKFTEIGERDKNIEYCVDYLDVDNFKRVNDLYGHNKGDLVLREVARILQENFRSGDVVGRIGGDEFIVIVYNCKKEALFKRLERIREIIEGAFRKYDLSVSYGIVTVPSEGTDINLILKLADERMYEMKRRKKGINFSREEKA